MTKYKEYLRSKGYKLECDYEFLPSFEGVQTVGTRVNLNEKTVSVVIVHTSIIVEEAIGIHGELVRNTAW